MKHYHINEYGNIYDITLEVQTYSAPIGLCVELVDNSEGYPVPYSRITVNIDEFVDPEYTGLIAAIDTNNNPDITKFLESNNLAKFTGKVATSGYCTYPIYKFDENALRESCPELFEKHMEMMNQHKKAYEKFINS